jgi:hypothetical protein
MKYQDESTKVSIVSVSRRAGLPHFGQAHVQERSYFASGLPLPSGTQVLGQHDRQVFVGHRHRRRTRRSG